MGVTRAEVKEIVYQAVPYVDMAKVFDFIHATNDVLIDRGIELPLEGQSTTTPETRMSQGLAAENEIVGTEVVEQLYASAPDDELHIQRLLSANCFGDHNTRTGVNARTRELLTFAMLASLGGCEPQARGHVAANLNVGNDREVLLGVVTFAGKVQRHDIGAPVIDHAEVKHGRLVENAVQLVCVGDLLVGSAHLRCFAHDRLPSLMVVALRLSSWDYLDCPVPGWR